MTGSGGWSDPERGVLPAGTVYVESPSGTRFKELMEDNGWKPDEPWTPLRLDLTDPAENARVDEEALRAANGGQSLKSVHDARLLQALAEHRLGAVFVELAPGAGARFLDAEPDELGDGTPRARQLGPGRCRGQDRAARRPVTDPTAAQSSTRSSR